MLQHPAVLQALARDRAAELRRGAQSTATIRRETGWHTLVAAARRGAGWLLVDMGLRLAVPRSDQRDRAARGQLMTLLQRSRSA